MFTSFLPSSRGDGQADGQVAGLSLAEMKGSASTKWCSSIQDAVSRNAVLIFSSDSLAAALLAAAVELAGFLPHFSAAGETARNAVRRVRPGVVLIDCDHEETCSEEFIGPALMMKCRLVLFRSRATKRDVSEFAPRLGLRVLEMPQDHEAFSTIFSELMKT